MKLTEIIESYKDDIIKGVQELIQIKSVEGEPAENMPFGLGPYEGLKYVLDLAAEMGLKVKNYDNYAGHVDFGDGDKTIGILTHIDVVPEGEEWTYPPYNGEIHDGKIYGRGAIDDKGPTIATLYAIKALKESGMKLNNRVRLIIGTNEETGWGGINYYLEKEKAPDMGFTPDSDFPVIHGEKGIMVLKFKKNFNKQLENQINIKSIKGGNAANSVPDSCIANFKVDNDMKQSIIEKINKYSDKDTSLAYEDKGSELIIKSKGKSAHGSTPEEGKNAISQFMNFLGKLDIDNKELKEFIGIYNQKIGMEYNGESIGCGFEDELSGKLTFNVGTISFDEEILEFLVDIRYPITLESQRIVNSLNNELKNTGITAVQVDHMEPIYKPLDHPLINKLMKVYQEETGDVESKPLVIGGGTYARAMKDIVAFGVLFPGQIDLMHQRDEFIKIEDLMLCTKIFAKAIYELAK